MTWLLKLYPPRWRRRYGEEFRALIAPQPFSITTAIDIIGGALDAWTRPQSHLTRAAHTEGDTIMLARLMKLDCARGPEVTAGDGLKGAAVILGGSFAALVVTYLLRQQPGEHPYRMAFLSNAWLFFFVISMRYWLVKRWSARAQAVYIGGLLSVIGGMTLLAGWLGR